MSLQRRVVDIPNVAIGVEKQRLTEQSYIRCADRERERDEVHRYLVDIHTAWGWFSWRYVQ